MERTFRTLVCTEEKGVCTLLLNAPPVNVITRALLEELDEAFQTLEFHTDLRAVVLSSALPKLFCAGADIKQFQTWTSATGSENCRFGSQVYRRIERFPRPVLCAVNGSAFGGGLELAMACDVRIFDERARVALPECTLGMQPGYGGTQRLPRLVGRGAASLLLFSGNMIDAAEALRIGLVDKIVPHDALAAEVSALAEGIARQARCAVQQTKRCIRHGLESGLESGLSYEAQAFGLCFSTKEQKDRMRAFVNRRR